MDERVMQFRVGVLVLATVIISIFLVLLFRDRPSFLRSTYKFNVHLPSARGVTDGTPVRKRGVLIGRVAAVHLEDNDVVVTIEIQSEFKLSTDEIATLQTSLLGDAEIEFKRQATPALTDA